VAPVGNLEEGFVYRGLWQTVKVTDKQSVSLSLSLSLWELCEGNLEGGLLYWELWKLGLKSTQRQAQKLILGFSPAAQTRTLFFNRTQSRVVIGLFIRNSTLRRYFYLIGLTNIPLCRRCGEEEETSALILCGCKGLASLRHTCVSGLLFLDPEDVKSVQVWGHLELQ
jgi:hypothetical protein